MTFMWKLKDRQTTRLIKDEYPNRRFKSCINWINQVTKEALEWIRSLNIEID